MAGGRPDADGRRGSCPGFVDMHCHGGGGHTFTTGDADAARAAAAFHLAHGTTTLLASLVSSPYELMRDATAAFAPLVGEGVIAGVHFEGPYLSDGPLRRAEPGVPARPRRWTSCAALIELGGGAVRMVTLAPSCPARWTRSRCSSRTGVVAAIGHTDATYEQTLAGVGGRRDGRHAPLQRHAAAAPPRARPGVRAARRAAGGLRADRRRRPPARRHAGVRRARRPGPDRAALITDAMAAAGMPDGDVRPGRPGGDRRRPGGPAGPRTARSPAAR